MTRRRRLFLGAGVIVLALGALILTGVRQSVVYFVTPSELMAEDRPAGRAYRLGGMVVQGSLKQDLAAHEQRFLLTRRQGIRPRLPPRHPAGPLRRGARGRGGRQAGRRRNVPGQHDHGEALRGVPGAGGGRPGPRGAPPDAPLRQRERQRPGEVPGALAHPVGRAPRRGTPRVRIPCGPPRRPLAPGRPPGSRLRADVVRRQGCQPREPSRQGRRPELLGVLVLPGVLRGGAGPRGQLAAGRAAGRGGARRGDPGQGSRPRSSSSSASASPSRTPPIPPGRSRSTTGSTGCPRRSSSTVGA